MFKVLGGDGKEYGPVSADALRQWVQQGRANAQTPIKPEGGTDWAAMSSFPEFAQIFAPPPPGMTAAVGGSPVGDKPTSKLAIWSLVMGILGFASCGFTAILTAPLGLIFGFKGMSGIKKSEGQLKGHGVALAGTIVSGASFMMLFVMFIFAAMLLPALSKAKSKATTIQCVNNQKQIALAVVMYAGDNGDAFPSSTNWCDLILNDVGTQRIFLCPGDTAQLQSGYAYNSKLSGLSNVPPNVVMIFESDSGWNASGGKELMITTPRHSNRYVIGLADGSVQQMTEEQVQNLRWDPSSNTSNDSNSNP